MSLKDMLQQKEKQAALQDKAKQVEEERKGSIVEQIKPTLPATTRAEIRVEAPIEVEPLLPEDAGKLPDYAFHVFNHRYEFKVGSGKVLKADAKNIYTPANKEEFEFLRLQVERGLIHFY